MHYTLCPKPYALINLRRLLIAAAILLSLQVSAPALAQGWKEAKGEHFIVYYGQDEKFAKEVLDKAEAYYRDIASGLGYPRYSEFWLWDKRTKIYIYPDHESFLKATGQPAWSHGMADYKKKEITSYVWSEGFIESLLPHEMAHLIFRDFVGFAGQVPLWLDEGVAQWAEAAKRDFMLGLARDLLNNDFLMTINELMKINLKYVKEKDVLYMREIVTKSGDAGVVFLTGDKLIKAYYVEGFSLVDFLIHKYGSSRFAQFCRELRDGKTLEEALRASYPAHIGNLKELQSEWVSFILSS
ncbi:MAG: hypothetical protein V1682_06145 [Candidatus Omnitrophota bacterium]